MKQVTDISSRFEELSYQLQNECLKDLQLKFPDSSTLETDVQEAVETPYGNEEL